MAPSTNMPTASTKPNNTTMFMVSPIRCSTSTPVRNDPGMATPTKDAERQPSTATTTIITSNTALMTLFSKVDKRSMMSVDLSCA